MDNFHRVPTLSLLSRCSPKTSSLPQGDQGLPSLQLLPGPRLPELQCAERCAEMSLPHFRNLLNFLILGNQSLFLQGPCAAVHAVPTAVQSPRAGRRDRRSCVSLCLAGWVTLAVGTVEKEQQRCPACQTRSVGEQLAVLGNWLPSFLPGRQAHHPAGWLPSGETLVERQDALTSWFADPAVMHESLLARVLGHRGVSFLLLAALLLKTILPGPPLNSDHLHLAFKTPNTEI